MPAASRALLLRLTVLGSGTIVPSLRRQPSGYLVEGSGAKVLLDCGSGTLRRLLQAGTHPDDVDLILISHIHLDHTSELPLLLFSARYAPAPRRRPLRLAGSSGFVEHFRGLESLYGEGLAAAGYERAVETLQEGGAARAGGIEIRCAPARHIPSSLAFRLQEGGASLVYTGDTEYCRSVVDLARGCDLLLCECSFPDGSPAKLHLTASDAGRIAAEAGARRLLLTHFYPACEAADIIGQARGAFSGEVIVAEDLMQAGIGG
jgi:ribonuclease BN (tRNA processing enzyme)